MASTSVSSSDGDRDRSSTPPPTPMPSPRPRKTPRLRDPFELPEDPLLRNPWSPPRTSFEGKSSKRRRIEDKQDKTLLHGFELQNHARKILESSDLSSLRDAIKDFANAKKSSYSTVFKSLAHHYPNAFSLKLAKLLETHPPLKIRTKTINLLHQILTDMRIINSTMVLEVKTPLLHSVKVESEESLLPPLCKTTSSVAARIYYYSLGGWMEFLEYVCSCFSSDARPSHMKGLLLLGELPVEAVDEHKDFWLEQRNYALLFANALKLIDLPDPKLQALIFEPSLMLMGMSNNLGMKEVTDCLLPILLHYIDQHSEEGVVVNRVKRLADLVSLDVGELFKGKEGHVFQCMLRLAELKGRGENLRLAAINVLKELDEAYMDPVQNLIKSLSPEDVRRVFSVSMAIMSRVVDVRLWYEVDKRECHQAGMTEVFKRGKFLLNWLCFEGDGAVVVPMTIEMITATYAPDKDWRVRHAAMLALGAIADGHKKGMIRHFEQAVRLVLNSLQNDQHKRVLWASLDAIKCLSEYKEQLRHSLYHMKCMARILHILNYSRCARLQASGVIAIRFLVTNLGLDKLASFGEEIVRLLLVLLKHEKQKLQEEAVEALTSVALSIPVSFRQFYYHTTMQSLKAILFDNYSQQRPKFLFRAKCLECMSIIVSKVEQDKFKGEEAVQVMESLISLEEKLSKTDYLTRGVILKALDRFCRCKGVVIDNFIQKMTPMLIVSAQLDIDLEAELPMDDDSLDGNSTEYLVETVRIRACNILSYCAVRSPQSFSTYCSKVSKIFVRWLGCSSKETRKASISALPNLLRGIRFGVQNQQSQRALTALIVQSVMEVTQKETDIGLTRSALRLLIKCIHISGSVFTTELIKMIADDINPIINKTVEIELNRHKAALDQKKRQKAAGTSEGASRSLPTEEIIKDATNLITATVEKFESRLSPYADDIMSNVAQYLVYN